MINKKRGWKRGFFLLFFLILLLPSVFATTTYKPIIHDAEVAKAPKLNLLGNYQTELWPGAATYSLPIEAPPGRNELKPIISLNYNSHLTNQRPSIVGTGWILTDNYIWRDVKGSFTNASDDRFWLLLNNQQQELVYVSSENRFHTKIESFLQITNSSGGNNSKGQFWVVRATDGTMYRFGYNSDSELVSNIQNYVTRWSLDLINDTHSNQIYYSYNESPTSDDVGAVYPSKIEYNNERSRVIEFILETSDRLDKWLVYENGNRIREARRIKEIQIKASNVLIRKYVLNYSIADYSSRSLLSSVTLFGSDGATALPSLTFEYYNGTKGWLEEPRFKIPNEISFDGGSASRLTDLNKDGLIDFVRAEQWRPWNNVSIIHNGTGWENASQWNVPYWFTVNVGPGVLQSFDAGTRLIDFDGDGFTDLVLGDGSTRKSWRNSGNGWLADNSTWHLPTNAEPVNTAGVIDDRGVRFTDFNGDGLVDILSATDDWNYAWRNNGAGWTLDNSWTVPSTAVFIIYPAGTDEGVRIEDVNGDNFPDLVKGKYNDRRTWLNNGSGWVQDSTWTIPAEANFTNQTGHDRGVRLIDLNGDSLVDIARSFRMDEDTWINNGSGWIKDALWNVPPKVTFVTPHYSNRENGRLADLNGDGLVDIFADRTITDFSWTFVNRGEKNYLLKSIRNNLGGATKIEYLKSTVLNNSMVQNNSEIGFNLWVVQKITNKNGMPGPQNFSWNIVYDYHGGFYDYGDREFRGFNNVEEITPVNIVEHWFFQNDSLKGKEYERYIYDLNSSPYQRMLFDWRVDGQNGYFNTTLSSMTMYHHDGINANITVTKETYSYDIYGNVVSIDYLGKNSTTGDERYEDWQFVYNANQWIVNKPKNYTLLDADNVKLRETTYIYDSLSYGSSPTKGDVTTKQDYLAGGNNPTTTYQYDMYGNVIQETDPRGFSATYTFGTVDTTSTFVDKITNPKNHSFSYTYDLGTGNTLTETDQNGMVTTYTYDVFGRIVKQISPYDSASFPTLEYEYSLDGVAPEKVTIKQREINGTSNTLDTSYFYDGFGNVVQFKKEAEESQQIIVDTYYDSESRISTVSNPYFSITISSYTTPNISVKNTTYTYDPLSRLTLVNNPDGTQRNISYQRSKVTYFDENNHKKINVLDAYGQITDVVEYVGRNYFTTTYKYDAAGDLHAINDSYNDVVRYTYDTLGRKTRENSQNLGQWEYSYDENSNLIYKKDNRNISISIQYDSLNRIIVKNSSSQNITYFYDIEKNNTLSAVIAPSYQRNYTYDQRYRIETETKVIDESKFSTELTYDSADRITSQKNPDNAQTIYIYNQQGLLETISGVLNDINYSAIDFPIKRSYANNLISEFSYNQSNNKLLRIKTGSLQDLNYSYDAVGNVKEIKDTTNAKTKTMQYDELSRLVSITVSNTTTNYTYTPTANLLKIFGINVDNTTLYYKDQPVHAPVKAVLPDEAPKYSNIVETPTDPTINYSFNAKYRFNITWTDDIAVSAVTLEFDGVNYTDVSQNSNVYGKEFTNLALGTHTYRWYATDGSKTSNTSALSYTINKGIHAFDFLNSTGGIVAWFGHLGHLVLKYPIQQNSNYQIASDDLFVIRNNGQDVFIVAKNGTIYIDGTLNQNQPSLSSSESSNDFRIRNSSSLVSYVNNTGHLFLTQSIIENGIN